MRWGVLSVVMLSALVLSIGYSPSISIASTVGASVGAYMGENLAVPILILSSKLGLIDEEEIFSPFSTVLYDAMDDGFVVGAFLGAILVDSFLNPSIENALLESVACLLLMSVEDSDLKRLSSLVVSSILGGIVW